MSRSERYLMLKNLHKKQEAAQTENEIKKRIEDKLGELDKGSIDTTKNKQRKVTNKDKSGGMDKANKDFDDLDWITLGNTLMEQGLESS